MCYTSGTTGNPKGVVYTHRSTFLHSLALCSAGCLGVTENDRVLPVVPMFHANAWGSPVRRVGSSARTSSCRAATCKPEPLAGFIAAEQATIAGRCADHLGRPAALRATSTRTRSTSRRSALVPCGGSAVPQHADRGASEDRYGVQRHPGLGHDRDQPRRRAVAHPPGGIACGSPKTWTGGRAAGRVVARRRAAHRRRRRRPLPGTTRRSARSRCGDRGSPASYYRDTSTEKFDDGWLRTGDIGTIDPHGFVRITDRSKDVIKSGGEWISSVELESHLMAHPAVAEASVIGVPDAKLGRAPARLRGRRRRRPTLDLNGSAHVPGRERRPSWQVPERWAFIDEVPKTSVGKFDKKSLRARHEAGELDVVEADATGPLTSDR